jgi:hypothetical protein
VTMPVIRKLLESRLKTWADSHNPVLPVSWQNVDFNSPATGSYLMTHILPAPTGSEDLQGQHKAYIGIFQVSVVCPRGGGAALAESIAEEIATLFYTNLLLTSGAPVLGLQIVGAAILSKAIEADGKYTLPVSITYRADTT